MRKRIGVLLVAGVLATAGSVVPAAAAGSGPASSGASAGAVALSNLTMAKSGSSWGGSLNKQVTLQCEPAGGTHPRPEDACARITAVDGQLDRLPRASGVGCPGVWLPVTVTVTGTWRLQPVSFTRTYGNDCEAAVGSNFVFQF
ncbi:SSI family serine proteinase inhibitor [Streptomyces fragilis]|uniref:SSI family serine proteinase inhibitor n=1 Tax=Streptomyces fragilis TaxID=67301 RepID=A0ABV2YHG9_9ACTN|nr:SSI family serine proteinase inhibitor [Streptomyces fragilis]